MVLDKYLVNTMGKDRFRTMKYPHCVGEFPDCPKTEKDRRDIHGFVGECKGCPYGGQFKGIIPKVSIKEDPFKRKKS